jgi:hypothetical protein
MIRLLTYTFPFPRVVPQTSESVSPSFFQITLNPLIPDLPNPSCSPVPIPKHKTKTKVKEPVNEEEAINAYKRLIAALPRANQYLLLYVLDLLSVFARKADKNRMDAANLAVIFRPGILSHPEHELNPTEHRLSQRVLEFLIEHQDWFMVRFF